ncbi:MAG: glycoside hydrolase, partial [Gammaproteobacteria bacterium]|nr:glycoside hydrolase [Gammaproteobacteria bacterium]
MPAEQPMSVVLGWHMHQPEYRDLRSGRVHLPWTYLHATKDYVDMAAHLEAVPEARAVVNFAPILLEQIEDYASQVRSYLEGHGVIKDPLLAELAEPA